MPELTSYEKACADMYRLRELLENAAKDSSLIQVDEVDKKSYFNTNLINYGTEDQKKLLSEIDAILTDSFITKSGNPDFDMIRHAKRYSISVYAGDQDSFGWLTDCAQYRNGPIFVFG